MKTNKLKIFYVSIFLGIIAFSAKAQFICNVGNRAEILSNTSEYEYSGLAYHKDKNILFMPLDDPISGFHIRGFDTGTNNEFNVSIEGSFSSADFEGLTWLEQDYFVLLEEKQNKIYFLEYVHSSNLSNRKFIIKSSHSTGISTFDGDGLEGIGYNPNIKTLYTVREKDYRLYSIPIDLPDNSTTGANGAINGNLITNVQLPVNLFGSEDASGIFHLGKNSAPSNPLSNNILVVSHKLKKVFEFELILDANNNLTNNSINYINQTAINSEPQAEGIVVIDNEMLIASEKQSGGLHSYTVKYENESCNDGDANTLNDTVDASCNCVGIPDVCPLVSTVPLNANGQTVLQNEYVSSFFVITETSNASIPVDVVVKEDDAVNLKGCDITLYGGFVVEAGGTLNATIDPCQ